jgi:DNA-binding NtrC family response regulator
VNAHCIIEFKALCDSDRIVTALLVSPFESDHTVLSLVFSHSNWKLHSAYDSKAALSLMSKETIPIIICNLRNGDWKGLLEAAATLPNPSKLIVSSRLMDERLWAEAVNMGAHDVLATPFDAREVFRSVSMAWHSWQREERSATIRRKEPQSAANGILARAARPRP